MKSIIILNGDMARGGGTERMTQILSETLAKIPNYCVHIISITYCSESYYPLSNSVHLHSLHNTLGKIGMIKKFCELKRLLKELHADIVINVDVFLGIYSIPFKLFCKKIKIISWEMFNLKNNMGLSWCKHLRRFVLTFSDYYICLTNADTEAFKSFYKIKIPITYIYNPIEPKEIYNGYNINSKLIITVGNFFYTKGYDLAIDVADLVLPKHKDWKWIFYGDGVEMERLQKRVVRSEISNQIIFAGRTNNIIEKYKECAMYVMTSRLEGFGLVLLEAKCCNLPTIAYDVPCGPAEIIDHNVSGTLVPAFDTKAMADAIDELIINDNKRMEYSIKAQNNMSEFSIDKFSNKWQQIIESL